MVLAGLLGLLGSASVRAKAGQPLAAEFTQGIRPILTTYCYRCHGPEKQKGKLNLSVYKEWSQVAARPVVWRTVLERVQAYEMPPEKGREIPYQKRQQLMKWLQGLPQPKLECNQLASDRTLRFYRGYVMSRRLNRYEYQNTLRDLLGVDLDLASMLPSDGSGGEGFDNNGDTLFTSSLAIERYLNAADKALDAAFTAGHNGILAAGPSASVSPRQAARKAIAGFARRAFRRTVSGQEIERFLMLFDRAWGRGDSFSEAVRLALKAILISPHFLFLVETEPEFGGVQPLAPFPLASRLSYFLWASMPDDELLALAESGELPQEDIYRQQVHRMLQDPKANSLGRRFALQWLELDGLGSTQRPDPEQYPAFDDALAADLRQEAVLLFNAVLHDQGTLLDLIDGDYTYVNQRLAALYGLPKPRGSSWQRVHLQDRNRGGVLGMAAVHTVTSYPLRTSPVLRGKWILEVLLGDPVPPPPPNVPSLEVDDKTVSAASLRAELELHRTRPECAACHNRLDPLGFGLENFDVLGRWRTRTGDRPIDASGTLPSGRTFDGPAELKQILMSRKDKVIRHLVKKMAGYAFGRGLNRYDECVIKDTMAALKAHQYRGSVLIEEIATSFPFRHRFYAKEHKKP